MKFLALSVLVLSLSAFADNHEKKKETTTTTTTEAHSADHSHVDPKKADHSHDATHHEEKKTETKKSH